MNHTRESLTAKTTGSIASLRMVRAYPVRAALIWIGVHVFAALSLVLEGVSSGQVSSFGFAGTLILSIASALIVYFDARRRREMAFLQNLGVAAWMPATLAASTVVVLESILATIT